MMKIYTLVTAIMLSAATVSAQAIITYPSDTATATGMVYDEFDPFDVKLYVVNNTPDEQEFVWYMTGYTTPSPNWEVKLCDNNNCYDLLFNPGPYNSLPVPAGDTMEFKFQFSPHLIDGIGTADLVTYFESDSLGTVKNLFFQATIDAVTGIGSVNTSPISLYPNPVQNSFIVKGLENAGNLAFEVYNVAGKLVESNVKSADNSQIEISVATLPQGTYILKAFDANGKTIATSRLNKVD